MSKETFHYQITHPKDPGSAITHFMGVILVVLAAFPLLCRAAEEEQPVYLLSMGIFALSIFFLYSASTIYHTFNVSKKFNCVLRKLDHIMIYLLIAGTYTPICLIRLRDGGGITLFLLVWGVAFLGILQCVFSFTDIMALLNKTAFLWLLTGGIIYTIGGIIYACKFPIFNRIHKNFGSHEIFHCFVLAGSLCHFITMYHLF